MPNPTIIPKKSVQSGAVPTTSQLSLGEICVNHSDRRIYSRNPATGEIYKLAGAGEAPDRVFVFDSDGDTIRDLASEIERRRAHDAAAGVAR